ncbi:hypothetical protein BVY04_05040, partial [bacterium M21]
MTTFKEYSESLQWYHDAFAEAGRKMPISTQQIEGLLRWLLEAKSLLVIFDEVEGHLVAENQPKDVLNNITNALKIALEMLPSDHHTDATEGKKYFGAAMKELEAFKRMRYNNQINILSAYCTKAGDYNLPRLIDNKLQEASNGYQKELEKQEAIYEKMVAFTNRSSTTLTDLSNKAASRDEKMNKLASDIEKLHSETEQLYSDFGDEAKKAVANAAKATFENDQSRYRNMARGFGVLAVLFLLAIGVFAYCFVWPYLSFFGADLVVAEINGVKP